MLETVVAILAVLLGFGPSLAFRWGARRRIYRVEDAPSRPVALVLGARLTSAGAPTTLLVHRLETARALLERGAADRLLLTGLSGAPVLDEVGTMRRWLLERGVPEERLILDGASPRTLDSFRRAGALLGVKNVAVVTNPFHLPRSLFLARLAGFDAIGIAARSAPPVSRGTMVKNQLRELVACLRALWDATRRGA